MFHIHLERTIGKDIDTVFEALSDHASYDQFPGVDKSSLFRLDHRRGEITLQYSGEGKTRVIWISREPLNNS